MVKYSFQREKLVCGLLVYGKYLFVLRRDTFFKIYIKLIGRRVSLITKIAASPSQSSSTLIFGSPVVPWMSWRYLDVTIWTYLFQGDF